MSEEMKFPKTLDEFIKQYSFIDNKQFYTNGSELIQTFRIKQWEEHKKLEFINWLESKNQFHYKNGKIEDNYILVSEVLNKVRGD